MKTQIALLVNIRLGWKFYTVIKKLDYYDTEFITSVQAPRKGVYLSRLQPCL